MPDIATIKKGIYMVVSEYPIKKAELFGAYAEGTYRLEGLFYIYLLASKKYFTKKTNLFLTSYNI